MKRVACVLLLLTTSSFNFCNETPTSCPVDPTSLTLYAYDTTTQSIQQVGHYQDITVNTNVILNGWKHTPGSAEFEGTHGLVTCCIMAGNTTATQPTTVYLQALCNGIIVQGSQIAISFDGTPNQIKSLITSCYAQCYSQPGTSIVFQFSASDPANKLIAQQDQPSVVVTAKY